MMNDVQHDGPLRAVGEVSVSGRRVRVHAFRCGTVTIKRCHHTGVLPEGTPSPVRFAAILADRRFAAPMPIWAYVLELPDGLVVVDTGADPAYNERSSWEGHQPERRLLHSFIKLRITRDEALPAQMVDVGLDPADVSAVVLTHQHIDHTGTVPAFPSAAIWTTAAEDAASRMIGAEQWRWRTPTTTVRHVETHGVPGALGPEAPLLDGGPVFAIHTPGHTPGSVTVRLASDDGDIWFTGDTSFTAEHMDPAAPTAGIHTDIRAVRRLQTLLRGRGPLFPSHDDGVPARIAMLGHVDGSGRP